MNQCGLKLAVEKAKKDFESIKIDFPKLRAYLVISSRFGQCKLTDRCEQIFQEFPKFFKQESAYIQLTEIDEKLGQLDKKYKELNSESGKERIQKELDFLKKQKDSLLSDLIPCEENFVEFCFDDLNYDLIRQLKKHPLVNQPEYMMRDAYIRVILFKLEAFFGTQSQDL